MTIKETRFSWVEYPCLETKDKIDKVTYEYIYKDLPIYSEIGENIVFILVTTYGIYHLEWNHYTNVLGIILAALN